MSVASKILNVSSSSLGETQLQHHSGAASSFTLHTVVQLRMKFTQTLFQLDVQHSQCVPRRHGDTERRELRVSGGVLKKVNERSVKYPKLKKNMRRKEIAINWELSNKLTREA